MTDRSDTADLTAIREWFAIADGGDAEGWFSTLHYVPQMVSEIERLRADAQHIMGINNRLRATLLRVLAEEDLWEGAKDYIRAVVS